MSPPTASSAKTKIDHRPLVVVVGNPNSGKTSLFNALTGSHQHVGNYPGVTVERVGATMRLGDRDVDLLDVPGLYSMTANSEDERVAIEVLRGRREGRPDLLLYVLDAGNLERNLYFFSQLADLDLPVVVALTMTDVVEKNGGRVDIERLQGLLEVEVVRVVGHRRTGLAELREALERNLGGSRRPNRDFGFPTSLEAKVASMAERMARIGVDASKNEVRQALLNPNSPFEETLAELPELRRYVEDGRRELAEQGIEGPALDMERRYDWCGMVSRAVLAKARTGRTTTEKIDLVLTHRVFGLAVFVAVMYLVFQSIYTFATPLMELIDGAFGRAGEAVRPALAGRPVLESLVVDGLITGVGSMVVFLPQILILFLFISVLEGSGYLARAAFLMDRLLGWAGLNGRAFIPLLSSFACAVPGIMAARVMPDPKSRLATILVAPLMSCSARLPVYLVLIGAFIEPRFGPFWAGFALFAMHLLGLAVAIPIIYLLNRKLLKGTRLPFVLELPPYQWPKARDVWITVYFRGKLFLKTAGTIIVALSLVIWALSYFPRSDDETRRYEREFVAANPGAGEAAIGRHVQARQLENSFLGRAGRTIEPVFAPAGFDWRISTAILSAFPAREVVVSSLGILFNLGSDTDESSTDLRDALARATWPDGRPLVTTWVAVGVMVFFALCCQCMATLAAIKRETNTWKWPLFVFAYMSALAYVAAVAIHRVGLWLG
ncbi:MAG: ferrous iron transport protein B [Fimbriimonadaceae bacterium]|nr:ferrous iron transport protein B [Fimbriimonadaceae bacterium]